MAYSYAQYQADRGLLGVRSGVAMLVPMALSRKLADKLAAADAADHAAIQAAYERLMAVAEIGPEAVPLPPRRPRQASAGPAGKAEPQAKPPDPAAIERERVALEAWQDALLAQKERHARRRAAWPELAPPFKEPPPPAP